MINYLWLFIKYFKRNEGVQTNRLSDLYYISLFNDNYQADLSLLRTPCDESFSDKVAFFSGLFFIILSVIFGAWRDVSELCDNFLLKKKPELC